MKLPSERQGPQSVEGLAGPPNVDPVCGVRIYVVYTYTYMYTLSVKKEFSAHRLRALGPCTAQTSKSAGYTLQDKASVGPHFEPYPD